MPKFEIIKVGDHLYDCHRYKMGNTTMTAMGCWDVKVLEVYPETRRALVSWNGNAPQIFFERRLTKLRRTPHPKARR